MQYNFKSKKSFKSWSEAREFAKSSWGKRKKDKTDSFTDSKGKLRVKRRPNSFDVIEWDVSKKVAPPKEEPAVEEIVTEVATEKDEE